MRHMIAMLSIVFVSTFLIAAQHNEVAGGGAPPSEIKPQKGSVLTEPKSQSPSMKPQISIHGIASLHNAAGDISQISSFPFQEPLSDDSSYYESCPFTLSNGDLFVVYASPARDNLFCVKSTDNGTTWSQPSFVCSANTFCAGLCGVRTKSGRLIIVWRNGTTGLTERYSDNDGTTWSSPISATANLNDYYATASQTLDGKVWLCYSRYDSTLYDDTFYRTSTDNGASWSSEQTFLATAYDEIYAAIVSKDSSTILAVYGDNSSGTPNLYSTTSTNGGATWSLPTSIENSSTTDTRPSLLRQSDATLWLVYQHYKPSTGGITQSDIAYKRSTDGGTTWSTISYLTSYTGYDGWFGASLKNNQPFVTFASYRWAVRYGQTHLWYGLIGTTADDNPPPALEGYSYNWTSAMLDVQAYVDDETGISNVQLYYVLNGSPTTGPIQMYDDGAHSDYGAGDKIYGASIGPFQLGDIVNFSFAITDVNFNSVNVQLGSSVYRAIHNAGNIGLIVGSNSELGDNGVTVGSSAHWPRTNGYDYLFDGGLWAGCEIGGRYAIVRQEYEQTNDWTKTSGTVFTLAPGVSDQDVDVTYDDQLASTPIGLRVHQQSYQWSDTTRDDFIIFKYTIANRGTNGMLDNVYVAQWLDPDVALETDAWNDRVAYDSQRHMLYMYNSAATPNGYFGIRLLGNGKSPYTAIAYVNGQDPSTSNEHYQFITQGNVSIPTLTSDYRFLLTAAPFSLAPNDSASIAYGIVLGNGLAELKTNADTMESVYQSKVATAVGERQASISSTPKEFQLLQNYPNPFNPSTTIGFAIPQKSVVRLKVYDILGKEVASLASGEYAPGTYSRTFDATTLPSGVYFYRLQAGTYSNTKELLLLK